MSDLTPQPTTAAQTYAAALDARLPHAEGDEADALHEIGALLGGLSERGFAHDLAAHLDAAADNARDAWGTLHPWRVAEAERYRETAAGAWLRQALAIAHAATVREAA